MPTLSPILLQHGSGGDAKTWFSLIEDAEEYGTPMPMQLAEEGYDIWIGNNRGTKYNQKH